jgi:hypothetical protein
MTMLDRRVSYEFVDSLIRAGAEVDQFLRNDKTWAGFAVEGLYGNVYVEFEVEVDDEERRKAYTEMVSDEPLIKAWPEPEPEQDPKRWMAYDHATKRFRAYD